MKDENRIVVSETLSSPHRLVKSTKAAFNLKHVGQYGRLILRDPAALKLSIGPQSINRALRLMNSLIKAIETRGYSVDVVDDSKFWNARGESRTIAVVMDETIEFRMEEPSKKVKVTPEEMEKRKKSYLWPYEYKYVPTGKLNLIIETYVGDGLRRSWSDSN